MNANNSATCNSKNYVYLIRNTLNIFILHTILINICFENGFYTIKYIFMYEYFYKRVDIRLLLKEFVTIHFQ